MQVTNEVWRRAVDGVTELAMVLYTPNGVAVTYAEPGAAMRQQVIRTEEFDGRSDGDEEIVQENLANMGYQLVLTSRFLV